MISMTEVMVSLLFEVTSHDLCHLSFFRRKSPGPGHTGGDDVPGGRDCHKAGMLGTFEAVPPVTFVTVIVGTPYFPVLSFTSVE